MKIKSLQNKLPKDLSIVAFFDIIAKGLAAVTSILLIRVLSVHVYATYVKFNAISSLIFGVMGTSMAVAYTRGGTEYTSRGLKCLKSIYFICFFLLIGTTVAFASLIPLVSQLYTASVIVVVVSIVYGFVQSINRINQSYFQVKGKFSTAGVIDNAKCLFLIIFLLMALFFAIKLDEKSIFLLFILSVAIPVTIGLVLIRKEEAGVIDDKLDKTTIKIIFVETGTLVLYYLLLNMMDQTDVILVNQLMDDIDLSNYGVALKYYQLLLTLQGSLYTVFLIRTSKKEIVDSKKKQAEISVKWLKKTVWYILALLVTANIFAKPVMNLLNGERYSNAIPAFRIFIIGATISYLFAPNVSVMMAAKKYKTLCLFTICGFVINAFIDILLIPHIGIVAAAIATVAGNAFLNIASFFSIHKRGREGD